MDMKSPHASASVVPGTFAPLRRTRSASMGPCHGVTSDPYLGGHSPATGPDTAHMSSLNNRPVLSGDEPSEGTYAPTRSRRLTAGREEERKLIARSLSPGASGRIRISEKSSNDEIDLKKFRAAFREIQGRLEQSTACASEDAEGNPDSVLRRAPRQFFLL